MAGKSLPIPVATFVRYVDCSAGLFSYPTAIGKSTCWKQCAEPAPSPLTASTRGLLEYLAWCPAAFAASSISLTVFSPATLWTAPISKSMVCLSLILQFTRLLTCVASFAGFSNGVVDAALDVLEGWKLYVLGMLALHW